MITRQPIRFKERVEVPREMRQYLWDHPEGSAPLEKMILRVFQYGSFGQLRFIFERYPAACFDIANRYTDVKRGVKYWINEWSKEIA